MNTIRENKNVDQWNIAYLILLGIALLDGFYHTTMFLYKDYWWLRIGVDAHSQLDLYFVIVVATFVFVKCTVKGNFNKKEQLISAMLIFTFCMIYVKTNHYYALILMGFLIIGAKEINYHTILKEYLLINGTFLLITMISAKIGIIENLYYVKRGGAWAFGIKYTTDFAAHVFTLICVYVILRNIKIRYGEIAGFYLISFFIYFFCKARMNTLCIFLLATCCLVLKIGTCIQQKSVLKKIGEWISKCMVFAAPVFALIFIGLTYCYSPDSSFFVKLDEFFSTRLSLGKSGWMKYGISLFGNYIPFVGMNGTTEVKSNYFFIDSSYVMILLCYGVVALVLVLLIYIMISEKIRRQHNWYFLCVLAVYALNSMVEHRILRITYAPFLLALFANVYVDRRKVISKKKDIDNKNITKN